MNELKKQTWAKVAALVLAIISGFALVVTGIATIVFGVVPETQMNASEMEDAIQKQLLKGYANYMMLDNGIIDAQKSDDEKEIQKIDWSGLDGGNICYSVIAQSADKTQEEVLYTNDASLDENTTQYAATVPDGGYTRDVMQQASLSSLLFGYANQNWYGGTDEWRQRVVKAVVYNREDGLFYAQSSSGNYYVMRNFLRYNEADTTEKVAETEEAATDFSTGGSNYSLIRNDDGSYYVDQNENKVDVKTIEKWLSQKQQFFFDEYVTCTVKADSGEYPVLESVHGIKEDKKVFIGDYSFYGDGTFEYNAASIEKNPSVQYVICLSAQDPLLKTTTLNNGVKDYMNDVHTLTNLICSFRKTSGLWVVLSAVIFLIFFVFLMQAAGRRRDDDEIHLIWFDKIPYGIVLVALGFIETGIIALMIIVCKALVWMNVTSGFCLGCELLLAAAAEYFVLLMCMSTATRLKARMFWQYTLCHQIFRPFRWFGSQIRENMSLTLRVGVILGVLTLTEMIVIAATDYDGGVEMMLFFLYKLVEIPFVFSVAFQLKKIFDGSRRMVNGDYSHPIDTKRMRGPFREHADHMNNIGQGISRAVDEQMKSERFKTELITNVSHDIKTPLTSIINYVDLLEKEDIDNPKVQEYLEVLDRQSARLKKLIEDLMEASKASTGNIKVELEECDATVMLTQVVGEFEDRAKKNDLDIVVSSPEPPANIMADGRHLWRVIDNLMSNICKYAQPGTRVYIDLEKYNGMVIMTFRNTSRYQLNISSEELMERFVRGDSSRNTEGSGLGLSIAKSLTELMGGNFAIQIDGDLFKAILSFDECE